ncbi:MAG TPA: histidine kinase N-terminal 7TM domain-containing protein [Chloroflexaceae bacterium]|nr:histidine kinase N-terminal 7TM domain-containing protein [Chloroflexaceae bacterium]
MIAILDQLNQLLSAVVLIVTFSLLAYIAMQNWRNDIARALLVLLAGVVVVYGGDLLLSRANRATTMEFLGRAQWLGIAAVPAAYIHLANGLFALGERQEQARRARWLVYLAYLGAGVTFLLVALGTELIVHGGLLSGPIAQFQPGPLFWAYVLFFLAGSLVAFAAILHSQRSALTFTQRRRLVYLGATFAAPGIGVFPFLMIGAPPVVPAAAILLLQSVASVIVAAMVTVMTYSIAFQGVLLPDRLIKQDFLRWWLYGPFVGITIILFMQAVPLLERLLGLPQNTLLTFGVMLMTVLMPIFVSRVKPYLDALVYMQDQEEIDYLRNLPRSTFTRADLRTLLENSLVAICGAMRVETGFVAAPGDGSYTIKAVCGARREVKRFVAEYPLDELMPQLATLPPRGRDTLPPTDAFLSCGGFCLLPLHSPDGLFLGALAVAYPPEQLRRGGGLAAETRQLISVLAHQMELALSTVQMQSQIFDALRGLGPEMQSLQQLASRLEQATPASLAEIDGDLILDPGFPQLVKDALTQFWGGPKLAESPLMGLRTVKRALESQGGSPTRALQAVLRQAIGNLRPDEQLDPSAQEWLLYNLLEGRFLQRKTVRDVANRLAMSESDFYRKQRIAIEQVARQLALMEDGEG